MPREPREPRRKSPKGKSGSTEQSIFRRLLRGTGQTPEWDNADPKLVLRVICLVTALGGAVQFGLTREQDQYSLRIWGDGEALPLYLRPTEDVNLWLEGIAEMFDGDRVAAFHNANPD